MFLMRRIRIDNLRFAIKEMKEYLVLSKENDKAETFYKTKIE
jgi:hypothetical protein